MSNLIHLHLSPMNGRYHTAGSNGKINLTKFSEFIDMLDDVLIDDEVTSHTAELV